MKLHIITYRISVATTSGDKYNQALPEEAGFTVDVTPIELLSGENRKMLKTGFKNLQKDNVFAKIVIIALKDVKTLFHYDITGDSLKNENLLCLSQNH